MQTIFILGAGLIFALIALNIGATKNPAAMLFLVLVFVLSGLLWQWTNGWPGIYVSAFMIGAFMWWAACVMAGVIAGVTLSARAASKLSQVCE
jgi:hypothetical protein